MEFQIDKKLSLKKRLIGLLEKINNESYIRSICENYISQLNEGVKPHKLAYGLITELSQFNWNYKVDHFLKSLNTVLNENYTTYQVANFITTYGLDRRVVDKSFYDRLNRIASSLGEKELRQEVKYGDINFYKDIIPEFRTIVETAHQLDNENPTLANAEITTPIVPIMEYGDGFVFYLSGQNFYYQPQNNTINPINGFPENKLYHKLVEASNFFKITKREATYSSDKSNTVIKVNYKKGEPFVTVNEKEFAVNENLRDNLIYSTNISQVEIPAINVAVFVAENFHRFVELDFAQTVKSKINEQQDSTFFKLGNSTLVVSQNRYTHERTFKMFEDINECVDYINKWTGFNVYESLDNMFGNKNTDNTLLQSAKSKLLKDINILTEQKVKIENSGLITENEELNIAYASINEELTKLKNKILNVNERLGIRSTFEEDTYVDAVTIGKYKSLPVGAVVKVNETAFNLALNENPVEVWVGEEKLFIPKKFLSL